MTLGPSNSPWRSIPNDTSGVTSYATTRIYSSSYVPCGLQSPHAPSPTKNFRTLLSPRKPKPTTSNLKPHPALHPRRSAMTVANLMSSLDMKVAPSPANASMFQRMALNQQDEAAKVVAEVTEVAEADVVVTNLTIENVVPQQLTHQRQVNQKSVKRTESKKNIVLLVGSLNGAQAQRHIPLQNTRLQPSKEWALPSSPKSIRLTPLSHRKLPTLLPTTLSILDSRWYILH